MSFSQGYMVIDGEPGRKLNVPKAANDNFKPDDHEPPPAVPGPAPRGLWP